MKERDKMKERDIVKNIKQYIESLGGYVVKQHGSIYGSTGTPDLLCCVKGHFVAIEVKRPGEVTSKAQDIRIMEIKKARGLAFKAESVEDVKENIISILFPPIK